MRASLISQIMRPRPRAVQSFRNFLAAALPQIVAVLLLLPTMAAAKEAPRGASSSSIEAFLKLYSYFPFRFESDDNEPFLLQASIGDKKLKLTVDTGCPFTIIDPRSTPGLKTFGELGIKLRDSLLGELTDPALLVLENLSFGPARFFNQPARAEKLDADFIALRYGGILGIDFLVRNFCVIDCAGRQIYFRGAKPTPEQATAIEKSFRQSGYTPIAIAPGLRMIVKASIRGLTTNWILDTGARYTFLEENELSRLKLTRESTTSTGTYLPQNLEGRLVGLQKIGLGTRKLTVARVPDLTIGDRSWKDVYVGIVDIKMSDLNEPDLLASDVHGFLGCDILISRGALIDFSSWTLWLPPEAKPRR
jgi:hypothetical protein